MISLIILCLWPRVLLKCPLPLPYLEVCYRFTDQDGVSEGRSSFEMLIFRGLGSMDWSSFLVTAAMAEERILSPCKNGNDHQTSPLSHNTANTRKFLIRKKRPLGEFWFVFKRNAEWSNNQYNTLASISASRRICRLSSEGDEGDSKGSLSAASSPIIWMIARKSWTQMTCNLRIRKIATNWGVKLISGCKKCFDYWWNMKGRTIE